MISAADLADARADLEAELQDTVTVRRATGSTLDENPESPTYLQEVPVYTTLAAGLDALVVLESSSARVHMDVGDHPVVTQLYMVTVPVSLETASPGDEVLVTATQDGRLDGRVLYVQDVRVGSLSLSRRLVCMDTPGD